MASNLLEQVHLEGTRLGAAMFLLRCGHCGLPGQERSGADDAAGTRNLLQAEQGHSRNPASLTTELIHAARLRKPHGIFLPAGSKLRNWGDRTPVGLVSGKATLGVFCLQTRNSLGRPNCTYPTIQPKKIHGITVNYTRTFSFGQDCYQRKKWDSTHVSNAFVDHVVNHQFPPVHLTSECLCSDAYIGLKLAFKVKRF
eukprot:SAG31_NODE_695_length_12765_cov_6.974499_5_plen_198_part_00